MNRRRALFALVMLLGLALAVEYQVDPSGGPLTLEDEVREAFEQWAAVEGATVRSERRDEAPNIIRYGEDGRFGPDAISLTVSRSENNEQTVKILVNPDASEALRRRALLHETGVLIGLSSVTERDIAAGERSVMSSAITPESPDALTSADEATLQDLRRFAPEDITRTGTVDFYDLFELAREYGRRGVNLSADINRDGVVDARDLELLREAYTFRAPSETPPEDREPDETPPPVPDEDFPELDDDDPDTPADDPHVDEDSALDEPDQDAPEHPPHPIPERGAEAEQDGSEGEDPGEDENDL